MMRIYLPVNILLIMLMALPLFIQTAQAENEISCPEKCVESRKNCDLSCSQIVGGGAKSKERRACVKACGGEQKECNERCLNPTPRPTLKPERYHDRSCPNACEFKAKDCNVACSKYTGGGAKSAERSICRQECSEGLNNCKNWCVNPSPKPTLKPDLLDTMPCPEACKTRNLNCEASCSSYVGGGAKSEKRSMCMNDCRESNDLCVTGCKETE